MNFKIAALVLLWWGLLAIGWMLRGWVAVGLELIASTVTALVFAEITGTK